MKQKKLVKLLLSSLLVVALVLTIVPVRAESVSVNYGAVYSLEQRQALSKIEDSWSEKCGDFNIIVGKTKSVKLIFPEDLDTDGVTVTYKSSNSNVASVSKSGKLTAKKKGSVKITTIFKDKYGNKMTFISEVVVVKNKAELKKQEAIDNMKDIQVLDGIYVKKGKKVFIEISYPYDRHLSSTLKGYGPQEIKSISYKVKDTKIATVSKKGSKDGYITGKKKGWTKVVVTFKDIYGYSYSYTANVFVNISQSDSFKLMHPEYFD